MMNNWREKAISITKYKVEENDYFDNLWTSISDVGKCFNDQKLTLNHYIEMEKKYIDAVQIIYNKFSNQKFKVFEVFKYEINNSRNIEDHNLISIVNTIENFKEFDLKFLEMIIKANLREYMSCSIVIDEISNTIIRFGYDFYMYLNSQISFNDELRLISSKVGLFIRK